MSKKAKNIKITNNTEDVVFTKVYKTTNYDKFKIIQGNRPLNVTKYTQLLESMKQEQLIIPIIVNENMEIIDGQHRVNACKELGLPVYYIINEGYGIEEVKRANLVSSNWTGHDYLNLHIANGNENYETFAELLHQSRMNLSDLVKIFAIASKINSDVMMFLFENGDLKVDKIEEVGQFIEALNDFNEYKESRRKSFIAAFSMLYFDPSKIWP